MRSLSRFRAQLDSTRREFISLWHATPAIVPALGGNGGFLRRWSNARAARRLIDDLAADVRRVPDTEPERLVWRERVRQRLQRFGEDRLGWPAGYRRLLLGDEFYESAVSFAREARAFDPSLRLEHVGQALRNVWIGNSFQMLLDLPVRLRPGLFAYSMLYPVTDNWLDDPAVPRAAKASFNQRFGLRLAGVEVQPVHETESAAAKLVARIESEFPRDRYAVVYESLLAIYEAQVRSVAQQAPGLDANDLLEITFAKGGSSVLADLYLVCEQPSKPETRFAFGYGVVLQLLDDLQDVGDDLATGHETLFTRAARRGSLDDVAGRLGAFLDHVLLRNGRFDRAEHADRVDLIRRNCLALWAGSVAGHPGHFSRRFRRAVERQWPVSFSSYRRLRRRAAARWNALFTIERADGRSPDRVRFAGSGSVGFRGDERLGFLDGI